MKTIEDLEAHRIWLIKNAMPGRAKFLKNAIMILDEFDKGKFDLRRHIDLEHGYLDVDVASLVHKIRLEQPECAVKSILLQLIVDYDVHVTEEVIRNILDEDVDEERRIEGWTP
jgi:hypothetical protein